jgi:hypothetical protein
MMRLVAMIACALALAACGSPPPSQERIETLLSGAVKLADTKLNEGLAPEASILLNAVERIDKQFPGAAELRQKLGDDADIFEVRGALGINRRQRVGRDTNFLARLVLWAPNRVFDLLDLVTFDVHLGLGVYANLHLTRALQAGAGFRGIFGVGAHDQRIVGLNTEGEAGVAALAFGTESVSGSAVGLPGGAAGGADKMIGLHRPSNHIYQSFRDYWAVGFGLTPGFVGVDFDLHPVQLADFLLGVLFIDFAKDDYGTSRGMQFDRLDWQLMRSLQDVERAKLWEAPPSEGEAAGD